MDGIQPTEVETLPTGHTLIRKPTLHLRWSKDGKLQQAWEEARMDSSDRQIGSRVDWRDVPTEK